MLALVTKQKARNFLTAESTANTKGFRKPAQVPQQKGIGGRRSIRRQRYAIQPYDTVRLEGKTYITSGCHNKGTRLLIPVNGKSKSVAISKVQVVCHAGAWIQII